MMFLNWQKSLKKVCLLLRIRTLYHQAVMYIYGIMNAKYEHKIKCFTVNFFKSFGAINSSVGVWRCGITGLKLFLYCLFHEGFHFTSIRYISQVVQLYFTRCWLFFARVKVSDSQGNIFWLWEMSLFFFKYSISSRVFYKQTQYCHYIGAGRDYCN